MLEAKIEKYVGAIYDIDDDENFLGTCFIISNDKHIVTCYHVIGDRYEDPYKEASKKGEITHKTVTVKFSKIKFKAKVIEELCDPESDVAILLLDKDPNSETANLGKKIDNNHDFYLCWF